MKKIFIILAGFCLAACNDPKSDKEEWVQLFNGRDLEGWTVKIAGYPAGENFGKTFRVEDGLLKVRYDAYDSLRGRFGHIFTDKEYSCYKLRVEYRFVDEQLAGGPEWAWRNNGAMLHAQSPESMSIDQNFPVSIEAQILGGNGIDERPTANVCTPGTEIYIDGALYPDHCCKSSSKTYTGDGWVTMEVVVLGDSIVHHIMEGDTVLTYTNLTIGGGGVRPVPDIAPGPLKKGRIAFQSESHPIDFRKIELLDLSGE